MIQSGYILIKKYATHCPEWNDIEDILYSVAWLNECEMFAFAFYFFLTKFVYDLIWLVGPKLFV